MSKEEKQAMDEFYQNEPIVGYSEEEMEDMYRRFTNIIKEQEKVTFGDEDLELETNHCFY